MALTTTQRNKLPRSAFVYAPKGKPRSQWKYPVPTKSMARKAGISEKQRQSIHASALSFAKSKSTMGSHATVSRVVKARRNR